MKVFTRIIKRTSKNKSYQDSSNINGIYIQSMSYHVLGTTVRVSNLVGIKRTAGNLLYIGVGLV